jgi:Carboxypeptidase regulatory-like domain/S-layer homology domain
MHGRPFYFASAVLFAGTTVAAAGPGSPDRPTVVKPSRFAVSAPVRSLPAARPTPGDDRHDLWVRTNHQPRPRNLVSTGERDAALQSSPVGGATMPPPILNIDGLNNTDNFNAFGFRVFPPDTNGAAGLDQYVQMVNLLARVFDKAGAPLTGPFKLSSLFGALGGICSTTDNGDPIVVYDQMADRWLLSQFAFTDDGFAAPYHECVAVSVTGDATGSWYLYDFVTPGFEFPDYPKFGVWPDAYYMTTNQFLGGISFDGAGAFAFDREKMLAGDPNAGMVYFNLDLASHPEGIGGMLPSNVDGRMPPAPGEPNVFSYFIATEFGDASDGLRMFDFSVDWDDPAASTFTERPESPVAVAAFDPRTPPGRRDIQQPPPAVDLAALDAIGDRLLHRLAYRNFGTHESLVVTHTVNVGPDPTLLGSYQAAPRWYELQRMGGAWSVAQQGTYAPDTDNRWMGSVAQDSLGNLALGYSVASISTFPSIRYAGRLTTDPDDTLGQAETELVAGTGVQLNTNPGSRWGDYSAMAIDPVDDCTFWYTQEYYTLASQGTSSAGWVTRIGSFVFPSCTAPPVGVLEGVITECDGGAPVEGAVVSLGNGYARVTDALGAYSMNVPPGTYTVSVTRNGYLAGGGKATVDDGLTTNADFCLDGIALVATDGFTLVAESCEPLNGVVDPGELVTISFCLQNAGGGATTDLMATLLPGGGVISPSGPQSYGIKDPGASVCRDFTFMADPFQACGGTVTATFQLRDGLTDLGSAVFTLQTGDLTAAGGEDFDSVTAPDLPAGWTTAGTGTVLWVTTTTTPDTPPNAAFADDTEVSIDKRLDSPPFAIASASAQLSFRNSYDTEEGWDGGVLEISIDGGPFTDILAAGGSFVEGGYNAFINPFAASPLAERPAWTGDSGGYVTTTVNLPAAAAGQDVVFRWRLAADDSFTAVGWWVDTLTFSEGVCCWAPAPVSMEADAVSSLASGPTGGTSNVNSVIEPGETFLINPGYFNGGPDPINQLGIFSNFTGPAGATYTIIDGTADYGIIDPGATNTCFDGLMDCPILSIDDPAVRPEMHWDTTIDEDPMLSAPSGVAETTRTWVLHVGESFADVPTSNIFYGFIETIFHKGITGGCGGANYCPDNPVTRAQMAVFLLKAEHGAAFLPPACTGVFADVPCPSLFADWIEQLAAEGITAGCGGGNYCPNNPVTRAQMAVFLLKTEHGSSYVPPACTGVFPDVACPSLFADWIEQLAAEGITAGCGGGNYCPNNPNTRGQMAVFLTKTFGLTLYGP